MIFLIVGLLLFITNHSLRLVAPQWRQRFIDNYGANTWKVLYSLFSLLALLLMIYGYGQSRADPVFLWSPPLATRHPAILLTWFAFILLAASGVKGNLIKARVGHPMYAGVKVWAFAHLIANGRLGDLVLFGTLMLWAVAGFSISRRRDRLAGIAYPAGNAGRTVLTVVAGTVAWAIFTFWLHRLLIGVPPITM
jgi:uncharacterized membrane protein